MTAPISLEELPARLRMLADDMKAVGAAVGYYGGFGPLGDWAQCMQEESPVMANKIAIHFEKMQGGRA